MIMQAPYDGYLSLRHRRHYRRIDPGIRRLVRELNRVGLKTCGSCQGHSDGRTAYIAFDLAQTKDAQVMADGRGVLAIYWER